MKATLPLPQYQSVYTESRDSVDGVLAPPSNDDFREAMSLFASGVTVVTAAGSDGPAGLTANAFSSVSMDPPLALVCIDKRSRSGLAVQAAGRFAVHVLGDDQAAAARAFARPGDEGFSLAGWRTAVCGTPLLDQFLTRLTCSTHAVHDGGDHLIVVGRIERIDLGAAGDAPLTYFRGRLGALSPAATN
jgi:flavin reductase (DIM6/NTAB) family NADH-FMN oxidoreductase RutF